MAAAYAPLPLDNRLSPLNETSVNLVIPNQLAIMTTIPHSFLVTDFEAKDNRYPVFSTDSGDRKRLSAVVIERSLDFAVEKHPPAGDLPRDGVVYPQMMGTAQDDILDDLPTQDLPPANPASPAQEPQLDIAISDANSPSQLGRGSMGSTNQTDTLFPDIRGDVGTPAIDSLEPMTDTSLTPQQKPRLNLPDEQSEQPEQTRSSPKQRQFPREIVPPSILSTPKHPSAPGAGNDSLRAGTQFPSPIIPSAASPSYKPTPVPIQVSSINRVLAQQPTYITPLSAPNPVNPVYSPGPPRFQEEVCVECAMRDQDMADIDVTSPGAWDRESDVYYTDFVRQEMEEEMEQSKHLDSSLKSHSDPNRPRARGGKLTEQNVKIWLTMNPREPQARQQTIELYVRTQSAFLEAEALARARALRESRALDSKMRDAYDHLRRSTYDLNVQPTDDSTGLRVRTSRSLSGPLASPSVEVRHSRNHSREVTLLENGMMVEHVDVRREEKEERERRRKEEKRERSRARKSSRSSPVDVTSMYSAHSPFPHPDSGFHTSMSNGHGSGQRPVSRYSQSSSRPLSPSIVPVPPTPPPMRSGGKRLQSQVSLGDAQSISSASYNRRSRFFAFRNWSEAWKSRESFAQSGIMSGSMMDMHVALDNENQFHVRPPVDIGSSGPSIRLGEQWPRRSLSTEREAQLDKPKKKKGLAKIWNIITRNKTSQNDVSVQPSRDATPSFERSDDDYPLAPPPPLSYLVSRTPGDRTIPNRHVPGSALPPSASPNCSSFVSAPSSMLPTPSSPRHPWPDPETSDWRKNVVNDLNRSPFPLPEEEMQHSSQFVELENPRNVHPVVSEPDMRQRMHEPLSVPNTAPPTAMSGSSTPRPASVMSFDKSLPPLPHESRLRPVTAQSDTRPRTMYTPESGGHAFGMAASPSSPLVPQAAFRQPEVRRQSFGGLSSRPDITRLAMPTDKHRDRTLPMRQRPSFGELDEFGASRHSLGRIDDPLHYQDGQKRPATPSKRRSKFGFATLLSKITNVHDSRMSLTTDHYPHDPWSSSDGRPDGSVNGYDYPRTPRMSLVSRKAIQELVDQDPEFVAYRYPSADQSVDILR